MSAISSLGASGLSPADYAGEPTAIRQGGAVAQKAYAEGMGFQNVLLSQLTQQMTQTIDGADPNDPDSSSSDDASAGGAYSSLESSALSQSITSGSGNALALQIAQSLDPALIGKLG